MPLLDASTAAAATCSVTLLASSGFVFVSFSSTMYSSPTSAVQKQAGNQTGNQAGAYTSELTEQGGGEGDGEERKKQHKQEQTEPQPEKQGTR